MPVQRNSEEIRLCQGIRHSNTGNVKTSYEWPINITQEVKLKP